jgi:hypothetical protein
MPKPEVPGGRTDLLHLDRPDRGGGDCGCGGGGGGGCCGGKRRGHGNPDGATTESMEATPTAMEV